MMPEQMNKVHLVGISEISMCGIAKMLLEKGIAISGSDKKQNEMTKRLNDMGVSIYKEYNREHVKDADVVVYCSIVAADNPEVKSALELNIPIIKRSELLDNYLKTEMGQTYKTALNGKKRLKEN